MPFRDPHGLVSQVPRDKLLAALRKNRDKHLKDYERAKRGWVKLLNKELLGLVRKLDDGNLTNNDLAIKNRKPEHYLKEYDEAIEIVEFATDQESFELDQNQFRAYIRDQWEWRERWVASNSSYIAAGR